MDQHPRSSSITSERKSRNHSPIVSPFVRSSQRRAPCWFPTFFSEPISRQWHLTRINSNSAQWQRLWFPFQLRESENWHKCSATRNRFVFSRNLLQSEINRGEPIERTSREISPVWCNRVKYQVVFVFMTSVASPWFNLCTCCKGMRVLQGQSWAIR